jgi:hypothetical protein
MAATDYDFHLTRTEIIDRAFRIIGANGPGQTVSGNMHEQGRIALNAMVSRWQSDHIFLWKQNSIEISLVDDTLSYTLPTDPQVLTVDEAYIRVNDNDTELEIIGWDEYIDLPNKQNKGDPVLVATKPSTTGLAIFTYPVIDVAGGKKLFLRVTEKLKDLDVANQSPETRSAWIDALSYGLADNLADEYSVSISERQHIGKKAGEFYRSVKKTDKKRPEVMVARGAY